MWRQLNELDRMFKAMDVLHSRMNRMYHDQDGFRYIGSGIPQMGPRTNLYDVGDHLEIRAEVPAISKEDLNVKLQGNYLEISGTRKEMAPEGYTKHRIERGTVNFSRSFTLPTDVDATKVEANLKDGILTLRLPKVEAAKPRQISIR